MIVTNINAIDTLSAITSINITNAIVAVQEAWTFEHLSQSLCDNGFTLSDNGEFENTVVDGDTTATVRIEHTISSVGAHAFTVTSWACEGDDFSTITLTTHRAF